ncbi:MAG: amidohydrolase family protein [archaeon]|nr:amidohydrolase family protein [archaeon]
MIRAIDIHANIGTDLMYGFSQTPEQLIKKMDMANVEKAVLQPIPMPDNAQIPKINDYVRAAIDKYPDRFVGFCCVSPSDPNVTNEIDRAVDKLGLSGILLDYDTFMGAYPKPKIDLVFEKAREHEIPVLLQSIPGQSRYLGDNLAEEINALAEKFTDVSIIVHQMIPSIKFFFQKNSNLLLNTGHCLDNRTIETYSSLFGAGRILYGSNSPKEHPLVRRLYIDEAEITDYQKELILRRNAARLLGIS